MRRRRGDARPGGRRDPGWRRSPARRCLRCPWGRLTGRVRRGQPLPPESRLHQTALFAPPVSEEDLYDVVDVLAEISEETGRAIPQIAVNWLLTRRTVASVIIGARNEAQLRQNLGAVGWALAPEYLEKLEAATARTAPYPYFPYYRQAGFARLNPPIVATAP
nr:aldo/keto reductase [Parafrankia elaeagni]